MHPQRRDLKDGGREAGGTRLVSYPARIGARARRWGVGLGQSLVVSVIGDKLMPFRGPNEYVRRGRGPSWSGGVAGLTRRGGGPVPLKAT